MYQEGKTVTDEDQISEVGTSDSEESDDVSYPPKGEMLQKMASYIQEQKSIAPDIKVTLSPPADKKIIPTETQCFYCDGELSAPKLENPRATLASLDEAPRSDYMVYFKQCQSCLLPYRYSDTDLGIFNFNNKLLQFLFG